MKRVFHFQVAGHPQPKERPRRGRGRNFYTPPKTKSYETLIKTTFCSLYTMLDDADSKWFLSINIYAHGHVGDIDNIAKSVMDGLEHMVYANDKQVTQLNVNLHRVAKHEKEYIVLYLKEV